MLEVLTKHIKGETDPRVCVVSRWISKLSQEEQDAFLEVQNHSQQIQVALLFKELNNETKLPFKLTAFRSHIRGYCTCQH